MDYRCECCRQWKADTRARRAIMNGTRYLSNLCDGCANARDAHSYASANGDRQFRPQLPRVTHARAANPAPAAL